MESLSNKCCISTENFYLCDKSMDILLKPSKIVHRRMHVTILWLKTLEKYTSGKTDLKTDRNINSCRELQNPLYVFQ